MISKGAAINPDAPAISLIGSGADYKEAQTTDYKSLMSSINATANFLNDLGVKSNDVITYLLPIIPQTHFVLWGAEAVGIANPINHMLEPKGYGR